MRVCEILIVFYIVTFSGVVVPSPSDSPLITPRPQAYLSPVPLARAPTDLAANALLTMFHQTEHRRDPQSLQQGQQGKVYIDRNCVVCIKFVRSHFCTQLAWCQQG